MPSRASSRLELPDEEALAARLGGRERRALGMFFTPRPVVQAVLDLAQPHLSEAPSAVIDPACGAGAFLAAAADRFPAARLFGLELSAAAARACRARVPQALVLEGDGLKDGWPGLLDALPERGARLWIGNPPFNGTSAALKDKALYGTLQKLLPDRFKLPRGTSLRDDFAFFLLKAAQALRDTPGVLAFVLSASVLDSFLYAPVREALLAQLSLCEVAELGGGAFAGTQVKTCVTVWRSGGRAGRAPRFRARLGTDGLTFGPPAPFQPQPPEWRLKAVSNPAEALDARWREQGEPLSSVVPIHFAGLKTRFDELLVDASKERLLSRVEAFLACPADRLPAFAAAHAIPEGLLSKLSALKSRAAGVELSPGNVRRFFRYRGARHRGALPEDALAYCYLDRRLIPRGDHRMQGAYDPHACPFKLVFNTFELPLSAALVEVEGCVHAHRHARFAPLRVPQGLLQHGPAGIRRGAALGPDVPNLSPRALALAEAHGGPLALFRALVRFVNSAEVQGIWAPVFAAARPLPVPLTDDLFALP